MLIARNEIYPLGIANIQLCVRYQSHQSNKANQSLTDDAFDVQIIISELISRRYRIRNSSNEMESNEAANGDLHRTVMFLALRSSCTHVRMYV